MRKSEHYEAHSYGSGGVALVMQPDGNLVLHNNNWQPVWHTYTGGVH